MERVAPDLRRLKLVTAVDQFTLISEMELDLRLGPLLPASWPTIWTQMLAYMCHGLTLNTTSEMLVIEWVDGIHLDDVAALELPVMILARSPRLQPLFFQPGLS